MSIFIRRGDSKSFGSCHGCGKNFHTVGDFNMIELFLPSITFRLCETCQAEMIQAIRPSAINDQSTPVVIELRPLPLPEECEVMSMQEFTKAIRLGFVTPDDGSGYYANANGYCEKAPVFAPPEQALSTHKLPAREFFDRVVWFNK